MISTEAEQFDTWWAKFFTDLKSNGFRIDSITEQTLKTVAWAAWRERAKWVQA